MLQPGSWTLLMHLRNEGLDSEISRSQFGNRVILISTAGAPNFVIFLDFKFRQKIRRSGAP